MRPGLRLLNMILGFIVTACMLFGIRAIESVSRDTPSLHEQHLSDSLHTLWWLAFGFSLLIVLIDGFRTLYYTATIKLQRQLPHSLALGAHSLIVLDIHNPNTRAVDVAYTELYPDRVESPKLPLAFSVSANTSTTLNYAIKPIQRGSATFSDMLIRISSPWKFWQKTQRTKASDTIKVYPNFAPIAHSANISLDHQIAQLGIHLNQRRGEGSDFHQLREFRPGDALRQIDWNAMSRHLKPISREYQDVKDQDVIFLLDCGRRLRAKEDQTSHFDHALNALLLTSYVALRQGDAVGFMSFGGEQRWLAPVKHPSRINTLLNQLYDLQSSIETSDYLEAAQHFLSKHKKRALAIIITNLREEDTHDLQEAIKLLSQKHLVLIASLRDVFLDSQLIKPVQNLNSALSYCAINNYLRRRKRVLSQLNVASTVVVDALPHELHSLLVKEYMQLKRSGQI